MDEHSTGCGIVGQVQIQIDNLTFETEMIVSDGETKKLLLFASEKRTDYKKNREKEASGQGSGYGEKEKGKCGSTPA